MLLSEGSTIECFETWKFVWFYLSSFSYQLRSIFVLQEAFLDVFLSNNLYSCEGISSSLQKMGRRKCMLYTNSPRPAYECLPTYSALWRAKARKCHKSKKKKCLKYAYFRKVCLQFWNQKKSAYCIIFPYPTICQCAHNSYTRANISQLLYFQSLKFFWYWEN